MADADELDRQADELDRQAEPHLDALEQIVGTPTSHGGSLSLVPLTAPSSSPSPMSHMDLLILRRRTSEDEAGTESAALWTPPDDARTVDELIGQATDPFDFAPSAQSIRAWAAAQVDALDTAKRKASNDHAAYVAASVPGQVRRINDPGMPSLRYWLVWRDGSIVAGESRVGV